MPNKDQILVKERILAVASFFKGTSREQLSEELGITDDIFSEWLNKYGEIGYRLNWLTNENERLRKMFVDLSLFNQCLNDIIKEEQVKSCES